VSYTVHRVEIYSDEDRVALMRAVRVLIDRIAQREAEITHLRKVIRELEAVREKSKSEEVEPSGAPPDCTCGNRK
jgi:tRNA C32,U32 (ribose-2'-O)-methylase TrmJ